MLNCLHKWVDLKIEISTLHEKTPKTGVRTGMIDFARYTVSQSRTVPGAIGDKFASLAEFEIRKGDGMAHT